MASYLVKTQPFLVHVKSANGSTPLLLAYRLGRFDAAKILIQAGADQTAKDYQRNNLLHVALNAVPDTKILKPMLDLLDRSALIPMLKERNKLEQQGRTPLHQYCAATKHYLGKAANKVIRMFKLFSDISQEATNQAFKTLDGTGDTPLHTLLATDADPAIIRAVIDLDSSLLCYENAVGRTPAEVAHDRYLSIHIKAPGHNYYHRDTSLSSLVHQHPPGFIKEKECEEPREHESTATVAKNWRLCADSMARDGQPKRTLVSLNAANFVAKRLGEQNTRDRYQFKLVKIDEDTAAASTSSEDSDNEAGDAPAPVKPVVKPPVNAIAKTKPRRVDIVSERYYQTNDAWVRPRKEKKRSDDDASDNSDGDESVKDEDEDEDEDDELFPVCGKCGERHYRLWVAEMTTNLKKVQSSEDTEML